MQDDKVVEGKVRLARILGERMEKAFYPAARRSFTSETDVGTAFYAWAKAHELSFAGGFSFQGSGFLYEVCCP